MSKVKKSFQTVIFLLIVGMLLPKIAEITGNALADKIIAKAIINIAFSSATIIVGILFSIGFLRNRRMGGQTRVVLCVIIIVMLLCATSIVVSFIENVELWIVYLLSPLALVLILSIVFWYVVKMYNTKKQFRDTQNTNVEWAEEDVVNEQRGALVEQSEIKTEAVSIVPTKTLYQIWNEKTSTDSSIKVANLSNSNLKWVKIYNPPHKDGRFFGYIMMKNARNTFYGEIYYANKKIWNRIDL